MPVVTVRNTQPGCAVFRDEKTAAEYKWEGAGDDRGQDVQEVPEEVAQNIFFRRALNRGIFTILSEDESSAALARQSATWGSEQEQLLAQATAALEEGGEVALVTLTLTDEEDPETGLVRDATRLPSQSEIDRQVAEARK